MEPKIPAVIMLARERAGSFRRCVEILRQTWEHPSQLEELNFTLMLMRDLFGRKAARFEMDSPLLVMDWALRWANVKPPHSVDVLREARAILEAAAKDWADSFLLIQEMAKRRMELEKTCPDWILEAASAASGEALRIETVLRDSWPVGTQEEDEKSLEYIRCKGGMALEDAFAQAAGTSSDDWLRRVEEHKKHRPK